jgi:hypothetical protein
VESNRCLEDRDIHAQTFVEREMMTRSKGVRPCVSKWVIFRLVFAFRMTVVPAGGALTVVRKFRRTKSVFLKIRGARKNHCKIPPNAIMNQTIM